MTRTDCNDCHTPTHCLQMIGDPDRGGAWTRAFLGLRARELHVCGGMEGVEVIRQLCQQVSIAMLWLLAVQTGDSFEVHEYDRKLPLVAADRSLN
eukprot:16485-Heterococcus_DN1.PRE.2